MEALTLLPDCAGCGQPMTTPAVGCPFPVCAGCWDQRIPVPEPPVRLPGTPQDGSAGPTCQRHQTLSCQCDDCQLRMHLRDSEPWLYSNWGGPRLPEVERREAFAGFLERRTADDAG